MSELLITRPQQKRHGRIALLEAQHAVLKQIAAGSPLKQSLDRICSFVEALDEPTLCSVVLLQQDRYLRTLSAPSLSPAYSAAIDGAEVGPQVGSCGTAMWRGETVIVTDIETDPLWANYRHIARLHGLRACWSRPIVGAAGKVLGSFALYFKQPRRPSARSFEIMEVAAELAAVAIERATLDEQLSISLIRYQLAQRVTNLALLQRDFKTGQNYWSPEFRTMFDIPPEARPALRLAYSRVHRQDRQLLMLTHTRATQNGLPYEIRYRVCRTDGSIRHICERGAASYADDGSPKAMVAALQDETAHYDATMKLAALAHMAQKVNSHHALLPLMEFIVASACHLSTAQLACLSVKQGSAPINVCSGTAAPPASEQPAFWLRAGALVHQGADQPQPLRYLRGQHPDALISRGWWSMPLHARDGAEIGFVAVLDSGAGDFNAQDDRLLRQLVDIAAISIENVLLYADLEARVSERTRELERSNRELEAFSYTVSHDLRGPLRAISGFATLLEQEHSAQLDTQALDYLQRIKVSTRHMADLINGLLELGRVSRAEMTRVPVDLSALAARCAERITEQYPGRQVQLSITPGLQAAADPRLLELVFSNLLDNAWKFTRDQQPARVEVGSRLHEDEQLFYVADNGAGFDPQYAGQLFGVFQRLHTSTEFPGTGIGLATVERIIERHGGRVFAEGMPGAGASVFFTLPQ
jgi:signal transduction histidine kinase/PAS domain-containing protein